MTGWTRQLSRYSDWLQAGRSEDRIPLRARFSVPVQTGPGAHLASCTMGTGSFPGVKSGLGGTLTPHPLLVPWSRKSRAIPLLPLWAVRPVQGLSACTRVHFTLPYQPRPFRDTAYTIISPAYRTVKQSLLLILRENCKLIHSKSFYRSLFALLLLAPLKSAPILRIADSFYGLGASKEILQPETLVDH